MAAKLGARRGRPPKNNLPAGAPAPAIGHNSEQREKAEHAQLLSFVSRFRTQRIETDKMRALLKVETDREAEILRLAVAAGFKKGEFKEHIEDLSKRRGREIQEREERRLRHRRWLGLPVGEKQEDLVERMPDEAQDEMYWAAEGYRAGLTAGQRNLPEGIPPRMDQIWLTNFDKGVDSSKEIIADMAPGLTGGAAAVRAQAAKDFKADNPDVPEPGTPEALALERKQIAAAKEGLEKLGERQEEAPIEGEKPPAADESFEATEEELAAQSTRQAVRAEADAQAESEEVV